MGLLKILFEPRSGEAVRRQSFHLISDIPIQCAMLRDAVTEEMRRGEGMGRGSPKTNKRGHLQINKGLGLPRGAGKWAQLYSHDNFI